MKLLFAGSLLSLAAAPAFAQKPCEELKSEITAKLEAKGVKNYQLEIVATDAVKDQTVVGSCEFGTTRTTHPGPSAGEPVRRIANISGGVEASWVSQNGQKVVPRTNFLKWKSDGRTTSASATITQRPVKTSLRNWDIVYFSNLRLAVSLCLGLETQTSAPPAENLT